MKVIILCGGLGTRLREETEFRPKPMVPVGERPILWHIMKTYAHYGHKEFILCLGYKGDVIKDFFRNYHWNTSNITLKLGATPQIRYHNNHDEEDWSVTMLDTGQETQTGGRLKKALEFCEDETVLMTYGDGLCNLNINDSIAFHQKHKKISTMTAVSPQGRFGELAMDGTTISGFQEKPDKENAYINGGYFVLQRTVLEKLGKDQSVFETEALPQLAKENELQAFVHHGFWQCMDTFREQQILQELWNTGRAPWKVWA